VALPIVQCVNPALLTISFQELAPIKELAGSKGEGLYLGAEHRDAVDRGIVPLASEGLDLAPPIEITEFLPDLQLARAHIFPDWNVQTLDERVPEIGFELIDGAPDRHGLLEDGRQLLQGIRITDGKPHLWRGHTHTKPSVGSKPVYLDEFDLPLANLKAGHLAPCPCCWSNHPKYGLSGKIAWFPDEAIIRLLGPDCFAAMDQDAHAEALALMRQEKRRKQDIAYLLGVIGFDATAFFGDEKAIVVTAF